MKQTAKGHGGWTDQVAAWMNCGSGHIGESVNMTMMNNVPRASHVNSTQQKSPPWLPSTSDKNNLHQRMNRNCPPYVFDLSKVELEKDFNRHCNFTRHNL